MAGAGGQRRLQDFWTLGEELGKGGFSVVRRAQRVADGFEAAAKTLEKFGRYSGDLSLIRNEIKVMATILEKVDHENIVKLLDVFDDARCVHLLQELCRGGELFDRIQRESVFTEAGAAAIVKQVAQALHALHSNDILHRDLKPENLLYDSEDGDLIKLMDFGLSLVRNTPDPMVGLFGSIDYMAPEVLRERSFTTACDMWSLGVILYILLSGTLPFSGRNMKTKQFQIINCDYTFADEVWASVSEQAKGLVQALLTGDAKARLTAEEVLAHPWVADEGVATADAIKDHSSRFSKFNARRRFRVAAFACIAGSMRAVRRNLRDMLGDVKFNEKELHEIQAKFQSSSQAGETSVTYDEFVKVLNQLNLQGRTDAVNRRLFELFDVNHDGKVDFREFVAGLSNIRPSDNHQAQEEQIRFCFQLYDVDDSGTISIEELYSMLHAISGDDVHVAVDQADALANLFAEIDVNGDGHISFEEFNEAIKSDASLLEAFLK